MAQHRSNSTMVAAPGVGAGIHRQDCSDLVPEDLTQENLFEEHSIWRQSEGLFAFSCSPVNFMYSHSIKIKACGQIQIDACSPCFILRVCSLFRVM